MVGVVLVVAGCGRDVTPLGPTDAAAFDAQGASDVEPLADQTHAGVVTVLQTEFVAGGAAPEVRASFGQLDDDVIARWPLDASMGACTIHHRDHPSPPTPGAPVAGSLLFSAPARGWAVESDATATGVYAQNSAYPTLHTGDTVVVRAAGGDVPAFTLAVPFPPSIQATSPRPDATGAYVVDRAAGLSLAWTTESGSPDATVVVDLIQLRYPSTGLTVHEVGIECSFASAGGSGSATVPASALAALGPGASDTVTVLRFGTRVIGTVTAGAFVVDGVCARDVIIAAATVR